MNSEEVKRLRELEAKATPGPWQYNSNAAGVEAFPGFYFEHTSLGQTPLICSSPFWNLADGDVIVGLRNMLPELIAAVEERDRLREELRQREALTPSELGDCLRAIAKRLYGLDVVVCHDAAVAIDKLTDKLATEQAESERLRGVVRRLREMLHEALCVVRTPAFHKLCETLLKETKDI